MTIEECDYGKKVIREMIKHENDLINHRLTWLCQIQGLLFTALAVTWKYNDSIYVRYVLCFAGTLVAISSFYGLDAAVRAIEALNEKGEHLQTPICKLDLPVCGNSDYHPDFLLPWNIFPMMFIFIWVLISMLI